MPLPRLSLCPFETYPQLLTFLEQLDVSVMKLGTERVKQVLSCLGNPQDKVKTIHIVGTNGKGSVSATLSSIYQAAGYRTGLFTSPHLLDIRERIQQNGKPLSQDAFLQAAKVTHTAMQHVLPDPKDWLTYFEFINVMAFYTFALIKADIAIIEAGLGGRLDSTNVLTQPEAIIVTPISLDHTDRLGNTLPQIAWEKAGVFKPEIPVFTGFQPEDVMHTLTDMAIEKHSRLILVPKDRLTLGPIITEEPRCFRKLHDTTTNEVYSYPLLGRYQLQNLSLVLSVIEALSDVLPVSVPDLKAGIRNVSWPSRFQYFPEKNLIIDGSHNEAGFNSLMDTLQSDFPHASIHWGLSLLTTRLPEVLAPLIQHPKTAALTFLTPKSPKRFHSPATLRTALQSKTLPSIHLQESSLGAFLESPAAKPHELKIVTGSLYTAGYALQQMLKE